MPFPASSFVQVTSWEVADTTKTITLVFLMARTLVYDLEALQRNTTTKLSPVWSAYEAKRNIKLYVGTVISGGSSIALGGAPIHIKCRPCHEIATPPPPPPPPTHTQRARALPTVRNARASRKHTFCVCVCGGGGGGGGGNFLKVSVITKFNLIPEILFNNRERSFEILPACA